MPESIIAEQLIQDYRDTEYRVAGEAPFVLRIGEVSEPLRDLYRQNGCDCATYVTAHNPHSRNVGALSNTESHLRLAGELKARSLHFIEGVGVGRGGRWPGEPSFLVLALALEAARTLGCKYQQNAIVWCGQDAVPQLVLLQ